jgi:hypothetical protein
VSWRIGFVVLGASLGYDDPQTRFTYGVRFERALNCRHALNKDRERFVWGGVDGVLRNRVLSGNFTCLFAGMLGFSSFVIASRP